MDIEKPKFPFEPQKTPGYKPINTIQRSTVQKIISAMMAVPYFYAQACVPGLEKFTQQQIKEMYDLVLHNPPDNYSEPEIIHFPFTPEEDIVLLTYINKYTNLTFNEFISKYGFVFKPNRTNNSIKRRISQLKSFSSEEIDQIYEEFSESTAKEERFYESIIQKSPQLKKGLPSRPKKEQCYCLEDTIMNRIRYSRNPLIENEISSIRSSSLGLISKRFEPNDLAILINGHAKFSMKDKILIIGRQSSADVMDNDIDLGFFDSMVCTHVSRSQASIQFMLDGNFYCQNTGDSPFRINGMLISPKKVATVPDDSLFDFCNTIFLFFINKPLIHDLVKYNKKKALDKDEEEEEEFDDDDDDDSE